MFAVRLEAIASRLEAITRNKKLLGEACWIGEAFGVLRDDVQTCLLVGVS